MRKDRFILTGAILVFIGLTLFVSDVIDPIVTPFTHIFLMGSSEGKDVIFFLTIGSMFLLAPLFVSGGPLKRRIGSGHDKNTYLYAAIIIASLTYLIGITVEILLRVSLGVSVFTTFIAMDPPASTSIIHSHVFKASLSPVTSAIVPASSGIHTGTSLLGYMPSVLPWLLFALPAIYILGLLSLGDRRDYHIAILIFAISSTIIGIIDGGLFSTPALVGLSGMLGMSALRVPFNVGNLKIPALIIASLIVLRVILGVLGSSPEYYEVTILEPSEKLELEGFSVVSEEKLNNRSLIKISPDQNEMVLLDKLAFHLNGRCSGFFMTWNFFSFF